ncbi:hypothetical protein ACNTMW_14015 [Planosporangium sp. 12N6]|uniref:hypothetical protein n=1 Tax=Planosporangium spinosum TaxID=3402278 RepID=UPI003CF114A2
MGPEPASVVQRRTPVKILFNLGTYAAAVSPLVAVVRLVGGIPGTLTLRVLVGVLLGTVVFTAVNLCCLAQIVGVVNRVPPWSVIRSEFRLSGYLAIGTVATGLTAAVIGVRAPLLLSFMRAVGFASVNTSSLQIRGTDCFPPARFVRSAMVW